MGELLQRARAVLDTIRDLTRVESNRDKKGSEEFCGWVTGWVVVVGLYLLIEEEKDHVALI